MPQSPGPSNSPFTNAASMPVVSDTLTFLGPGIATQTSRELFADGLPGLNVWLRHTIGAAGLVSVRVQFAFGNETPATVTWEDVTPAFAIPFNVATLNNYHLGSRRYRLLVTANGTATVRYRLVAALT